jgi:hypothetical protein
VTRILGAVAQGEPHICQGLLLLRDAAAMVRGFIEEAQIAGQLQHLGIDPIDDLGTLADRRRGLSCRGDQTIRLRQWPP